MRRILAAGFLTVMAGPAFAGAFTPAAPGGMVLDLDSQSGNFSVWRIGDAGAIDAIRTTMQVHRLGTDAHWAPGFTISLMNGDDRVDFKVRSETGGLPLTVEFEARKGGKALDEQTFTFTAGLDQNLDVALDWTKDGTVAVKAGSEKRTIALGEPVKSIQFSASTGEVEFNPLQIGTSGP